MSSPLSVFNIPSDLTSRLPAREKVDEVYPRIPGLIDMARDWYRDSYEGADEKERMSREDSLRKVVRWYLRCAQVLQHEDGFSVSPQMVRITNEVLVTELGQFSWDVLEEPEPEEEVEEADDFDDLLGDWGVKLETPPAVEKGKKKVTEAEGSRKKTRGQKRKVEGGGDDDMEVQIVDGPGTKKKAKIQSERKGVDAEDADYDFGAMGVMPTDPTPPVRDTCKQCYIVEASCGPATGAKGSACERCRAKKIGCSFVDTPGTSGNRLTSNPMPKRSTSKKTRERELSVPIVLLPPVKTQPKAAAATAGKAPPAKETRPQPRATKASTKPPPAKNDAANLIPADKTTVYANKRYTGPNQIPEKSLADVIVPATKDDQGVALRVTRASTRQSAEADVNVMEQKSRDTSVRPGHAGETPRSTFAALRGGSPASIDFPDPFTRRLDSLSTSVRQHSMDLDKVSSKVRETSARVEAMSAIAIRQKDQELEELKRELAMQKSALVELEEGQRAFEEKFDHFREHEVQDTGSIALEEVEALRAKVESLPRIATQQQLDTVSEKLQTRVRNFIDLVNTTLRLNDSDGICKLPDEIDNLGGRVAGMEEDVRNVRRGRESIEERLGKLEGFCLNIVASDLFRARVSRAVGPDEAVEDDAVLKEVESGGDVQEGAAGLVDPRQEKGPDDAAAGHSTPSNDMQPHSPSFDGLLPSINEGQYIYNSVEGSPVDRAKALH